MRSYCCLLVLAVVSFPALISANNTTPIEEQPVTLAVSTTPKPLCKERMCPRIYMPVCGLVDGKMVTAPSPCDLDNKIKCSLYLRRSLGWKVPRVRFLHNGPCSAKKDESNVVRMRRDLPIGSNDEMSAADVEVEGKNKWDELGESIELINDSDESGESVGVADSQQKTASDEHSEHDMSSSEEEDEEREKKARKVELMQLELEAMEILDAHDEAEADMKEAEADKAQKEADLSEELTDWDAEAGNDHHEHYDGDHLEGDHDEEDHLDEDHYEEDHLDEDHDDEDHLDEDHGNKDGEVDVAKGDVMEGVHDDGKKEA